MAYILGRKKLHFISILALSSAAICLLLMVARTYYAVSFDIPLQGPTRGAEFENFYSIWLYINGKPVYLDPDKIPFAVSFYNWLFYASYGEIVRAFLWAFSLEDVWIPTITRLTTLTGCIVGATISFFVFNKWSGIIDWPLKFITLSFSILTFIGPLVGFFGISATSDIWVMVINIAGVGYFMEKYPKAPLRTTLIICALSYVTWSFKQNFLYLPGGIGLFLLYRRDWKNAAILAMLPMAAFAVTLIIGGPIYRHALSFADASVPYIWEVFLRNIANLSVKVLPAITTSIILVFIYGKSEELRSNFIKSIKNTPELLVPFFCFAVSAVEAFASTGFYGTSENHYFTFLMFWSFIILILLKPASENFVYANFCASIMGLGWVGNFLAVGSVLVGINGIVSVRSFHESLATSLACLTDIQQPVFIENPYLALPWMVPSEQPFVINFNYASDRIAGVKKESGGIGGLIDKKFFATVVLGMRNNDQFDGGSMKGYAKAYSCNGYNVYKRI